MKKILLLVLAATLVCSASLFTACSLAKNLMFASMLFVINL